MSLTRTTCPYCGVGCGVLAGADGTMRGDPEHPANFGRLCSKGAALGETIDLSGRLLSPRMGGRDVSWDAALDAVAGAFSNAIRDHGPDSVAFYVSGQLLTEDYYVANKLMKGFIGSANIDTNSRLCMASSVAGHKRAFGSDTVPGTYEDLEEADLIVLVGSNLAWCHPVLHQRIEAARAMRPGLRVIAVDPRRSATAQAADTHLAVAPEGDAALFNGLLCHLVDTGAVNGAWTAAHTTGLGAALRAARGTDPSASGLTAEELCAFYRAWAGAERVVTIYSQGVNQSAAGTDKVNAILNCHLATGRIGKPGSGPFSVTGQPNAMGGREVGGLANMLANHLDLENADHRDAVRGFWEAPGMAAKPGLKAVDLFRACARGQIKALWVMSTNPAVSMPDADGVAAAIRGVPFVAVTDIMARTDTGDLADVLLPAAGWGEKNGTVTNSERRISRQRAFLPVPGAARPDWKIICDVAARMGWGEAFAYRSPEQIFAEYVALSKATRRFGRGLDLTGFEGVDYDAFMPRQWPADGRRFFADGRFHTPDGKARFVPVTPPAPSAETRLNTGRNRDQWHTMTRTGKAPRLGAHLAEPYLEIHPDDAAARGIAPGDLATVEAGGACAVLRALVTDRVAPGRPFAPMHWTRQLSRGGVVNAAVPAVTDPVSGQPALKDAPVAIGRFDAAWFGFAASTARPEPSGAYAALARTRTGWQMEMADIAAPDHWEAVARSACAQPDAALSLATVDGGLRAAFSDGERLVGLFFAAPRPVALARAHVVALIGTRTPPLAALAGRAPADRPDPGPTVCACFDVGRNTLSAAIAGGARSVEALGRATCAGTNCGSCRPELAQLIEALPAPMAAE